MSEKIVSKWSVAWVRLTDKKAVVSTVALTEGYTTMNDIPKMLAIKAGIDPSQVKLVSLLALELLPTRGMEG